jgi:hypothetical protein
MTNINDILTAPEAAALWSLDVSTIKKACIAGKFTVDECRKSGSAWLITRSGMERVYGQPKASQ